MLRFVPVVIVGVLCASAAFGAGAVTDMPAIVEFAFLTCLALFFAMVLASTTATSSEGELGQLKPTMILRHDHWPRVSMRSGTQFARKVAATLKSLPRSRNDRGNR